MPLITASEAAALTGKSLATISRLCAKHKGSPSLRKQGRSWLIDRDWLLQQIAPQPAEQQATTPPPPEPLLQALHVQIEELQKDKHFLQAQLEKAADRNRELNYLLGNAQKQLQAPKPPAQAQPAPQPRPSLDPNWLYLLIFAGVLVALMGLAVYLKQ